MDMAGKVLELLEDSESPLSGEEIAERLGVTRNSVWKAVQKLRGEGYEIDAGTNRGYRLLSAGNVLSPENIRRRLTGPARCVAVDVRETVTSTNTVVKELAEQGGAEGMTVIAEQQTGGKGRLGRSFYSPRDTGLYMSILLRPKFTAEESLSITTAAAVAVAGAIEEVTGKRALIKWVNDVYVDGYKVCGILTEASIDFESGGLHYAVLGIGINVRAPEGGFSEELKQVAGALYQEEPPAGTRTALAAAVLNRFFGYYHDMPGRTYLPDYQRRSLLTGMKVNFQRGDAPRQTGLVLGVDDRARLLVKLEDGNELAFSAGEVNIEKDFLERMRKHGA